MDPNHAGLRDSPSEIPASFIKYHFPYFTPVELERLSEKQRGKLSVTQEERARQQACGFIEAVGAKIGFPRKTIATAQNLYHRFHLFFPRKDFSYHDVCLAALYVSSKMHDTLKKPREILMVAYAVRFPELAAKSKSVAGEVDMDPATVEHDRQRLLAVERLLLETVCFNFTSRMPFPYVIKIGRSFKATKKLTKLAWRLVIDSHRTVVNLEYPPHVVALGCVYLAALLSSFEQATSPKRAGYSSGDQIAAALGKPGHWEEQFQAHVEDLEEIAHAIIDLLIVAAQNPLANTSPTTPSSPSPHLSRSQHTPSAANVQLPPLPYKSDQLIRLKIVMRESEHAPRQRQSAARNDMYAEVEASLGRNEGTVRFLFGPPGSADDIV
ncbi:CTD kinase subunit beta [Sparassis crispa]|uniref:CTD kinase subunit beta n=1 Tax=Sparassis crispa TaxID=139825 RepID=A0A401GSI7_9APHY|nr:CTD kinase subunit beta [Sparassis crispa]GBE85176.1 CTD kinase subunit beta [Sparassis crispa]